MPATSAGMTNQISSALELFCGLHRARRVAAGLDAGEIRKPIVQQHGLLAGLDGGSLIRLDIDRRVLLERCPGAEPGAREQEIYAVAHGFEARALGELE